MKWDFDKLENKLLNISNNLKKCDENLKKTAENIFYKDETNSSQETLKDIVGEDFGYIIANKKYKQWISSYSKEYIELSEWYYGEELPYTIYCKEFQKNKGTYLDSPEDVKELYKLFFFYGMLELFFCKR
tara:strand:- start:2481 stop:2870 length:390 start_codon:yes stop_codon:yes gene_type:complete